MAKLITWVGGEPFKMSAVFQQSQKTQVPYFHIPNLPHTLAFQMLELLKIN